MKYKYALDLDLQLALTSMGQKSVEKFGTFCVKFPSDY